MQDLSSVLLPRLWPHL